MTMTNYKIVKASSITYQHLAAVINTYMLKMDNSKVIKILDLGCGDGKLIGHICQALTILRPKFKIKIFGLDVSDANQQEKDYVVKTNQYLSQLHSDNVETEEMVVITSKDTLPYQENEFDFIITNQVMEHVHDHKFLFKEIFRCLNSNGVNINLFPLREVLWEGHAFMPIVHKIKNLELRRLFILFFARLGLNKQYHQGKQRYGWKSIEEFALRFAHILETDTNYISLRQLKTLVEETKFQISFKYTKNFFISKLNSMIGIRSYNYYAIKYLDFMCFALGKYLSNVTVILTKDLKRQL
ncbi:MAG: class I SAM-dependent methyltransferase [Melioribacteraceae bacterium]